MDARAEPVSDDSSHIRVVRLLHALRQLTAGDIDRLIEAVETGALATRGRDTSEIDLTAAPYGLTPREAEVAWLVYESGTNKTIAARLGLSARTVEIHRRHAAHKLGLGTSRGLIRKLTELVSS